MTDNMLKNPKKIPIGEQDFESLIKNGKFYLDKTNKIYELLQIGSKYNFFSRPRRFGKSLMLSVMKNILLGKKELFKGLFIYDKWDFEQFPVMYISLAGYSKDKDLKEHIKNYGKIYFDNKEKLINDFRFFDLGLILRQVSQSTGKQVVVLIDEYDKPVLANLQNYKIAEEIRIFFSDFYSTIKDSDEYIKLFFLTGLTKLMKMNIFSVLNNLDDISFDRRFCDLIGYTQEEVENNFSEEIEIIAELYNMKYRQFLEEIKTEYNGFNFGGNKLLYNPWDINNFITKQRLGYYWADTGIPGSIRDFVHTTPVDIKVLIDKVRVNKLVVSEMDLKVHDLNKLKPEVLLFNAGYLTINKEDERKRRYKLKFPNNETEQVMMEYFLDLSLNKKYNTYDWEQASEKIISGIFGKNQKLIQKGISYLINNVLEHIAYDWLNENPEGWLKTMVGIAIIMNNVYYVAENQNIIGRNDLHIPKDKTVYILELKINENADSCIKQIEKKYEANYQQNFQEIVKIGINWNRNKNEVQVIVV